MVDYKKLFNVVENSSRMAIAYSLNEANFCFDTVFSDINSDDEYIHLFFNNGSIDLEKSSIRDIEYDDDDITLYLTTGYLTLSII